MTTFTLDEVRKTFTNGEIEEEILKGINLSLKEGEVTALVGASGSGKSTLLTIAAGLQPASNGHIIFEGKNMAAMSSEEVRKVRASKFGFVFQFAHLVPFLTVEEQLMLMLDVSESTLSKQARKAEVGGASGKCGFTTIRNFQYKKTDFPTPKLRNSALFFVTP